MIGTKVYGIPRVAKRILIFDTVTETVSGSDVLSIDSVRSAGHWLGGVTVGKTVYGIPAQADSILIFTPPDLGVNALPMPKKRARKTLFSGHMSIPLISRHLRSLFTLSLNSHYSYPSKMFLDLYAGTEGITFAFHRRRFNCISFDIKFGPPQDLTSLTVIKTIRGWISSGCVHGVMLATQCSSWTHARRGPPGSAWGPIRSTF